MFTARFILARQRHNDPWSCYEETLDNLEAFGAVQLSPLANRKRFRYENKPRARDSIFAVSFWHNLGKCFKSVCNGDCKKGQARREENGKQCKKRKKTSPYIATYRQGNSMFYWTRDCGLLAMDYGSGTTGCIWTVNSGNFFIFLFFFFLGGGGGHNCKANTNINFLKILHIVNFLKITETLIHYQQKSSIKKQNWIQGWHKGKMADLFNWPFRLTKLVFFRARAVRAML